MTVGKVDIQFAEKKLIWRSYNTNKTLPTTKQLELINKKMFAKIALDKELETLVIYVVTKKAFLAEMTIHFLQVA